MADGPETPAASDLPASDPKALLDRQEAQARARLRAASRHLLDRERLRPHLERTAPMRWLERHPLGALAAACGLGFLLAPRRGRGGGRSAVLDQVSRLTSTGRMLVLGRVLDSLGGLLHGGGGASGDGNGHVPGNR